jgi:TetR/AcrR family transcriptional regulator, mexJK operon transcriptional repressor
MRPEKIRSKLDAVPARKPDVNSRHEERAARAARRPARGSGRIESADARRERIVRMAAPLFLKHGYDNVSIDDIIEVVGGSKATVYAWFGGKEGLFEAVVRQECQDVTMAIHVHGQPGGPAD